MSKEFRRFCFTLNNYSEDEYRNIVKQAEEQCSYAIVGKEVGEKGTPHLQGFFNLKDRKKLRLPGIKKLLGARCHVENARGDDLANQKYCSKEGSFVEFGTPQCKGKRNDLAKAADLLKESRSVAITAEQFPCQYIRYHRGFEALHSIYQNHEPRNFKTIVTVLTGPPGTGKSRYCYSESHRLAGSPDQVYYKPRGDWWDGYDGHAAVVIDDFYGWIKYDELLKICDRYPYRVPIKGGYRQFTSKWIFITSNKTIREWYKFADYSSAALYRRIENVYDGSVPDITVPPSDAPVGMGSQSLFPSLDNAGGETGGGVINISDDDDEVFCTDPLEYGGNEFPPTPIHYWSDSDDFRNQ